MTKRNTAHLTASELLAGLRVEFKCWDRLSDEALHDFESSVSENDDGTQCPGDKWNEWKDRII